MKVSRLGFGTFDFGVPSLRIAPQKGGEILAEAHRLGVTYWDTSDDYGSHPHVAAALQRIARKEVVISTKTSEKSGEAAERSLRRSLSELGTDYIDVFLLHYVMSDWLDACRRVLKELRTLRETGIAKAIGLSTHSVKVAQEAARFEELDAILAVCCNADETILKRFRSRIQLEDGTMEEMFGALRQAHANRKGVMAMKVLGNSTPPLVKEYRASIRSIASLDFVDTLVIGMKTLEEVRKNLEVIRLSQRRLGKRR